MGIMPALDMIRLLLHVGVALLVVVATRGGLSYARFLCETGEGE
jgi:hypothetical protein